MEAAQAAGCWSCHATWGVPINERDLGDVEVDMIAEMPEALLKLPLSR